MKREVVIELCEDAAAVASAIEFWTMDKNYRLVGKSELSDSVDYLRSRTAQNVYVQDGGGTIMYPREADAYVVVFEEI